MIIVGIKYLIPKGLESLDVVLINQDLTMVEK